MLCASLWRVTGPQRGAPCAKLTVRQGSRLAPSSCAMSLPLQRVCAALRTHTTHTYGGAAAAAIGAPLISASTAALSSSAHTSPPTTHTHPLLPHTHPHTHTHTHMRRPCLRPTRRRHACKARVQSRPPLHLGGHHLGDVDEAAAVTKLVVIPKIALHHRAVDDLRARGVDDARALQGVSGCVVHVFGRVWLCERVRGRRCVLAASKGGTRWCWHTHKAPTRARGPDQTHKNTHTHNAPRR